MYILFQSVQNHSPPILGTEYTPQCMKIPTLASSYHPGNGRLSKLAQFGSYLVRYPWPWPQRIVPIASIENANNFNFSMAFPLVVGVVYCPAFVSILNWHAGHDLLSRRSFFVLLISPALQFSFEIHSEWAKRQIRYCCGLTRAWHDRYIDNNSR